LRRDESRRQANVATRQTPLGIKSPFFRLAADGGFRFAGQRTLWIDSPRTWLRRRGPGSDRQPERLPAQFEGAGREPPGRPPGGSMVQ